MRNEGYGGKGSGAASLDGLIEVAHELVLCIGQQADAPEQVAFNDGSPRPSTVLHYLLDRPRGLQEGPVSGQRHIKCVCPLVLVPQKWTLLISGGGEDMAVS